MFLEINYFFGRTGLGGSKRFYRLLEAAIDSWLAGLGLTSTRPAAPTDIKAVP
jgi:ribosomal protein S6--L-glutamate ligase